MTNHCILFWKSCLCLSWAEGRLFFFPTDGRAEDYRPVPRIVYGLPRNLVEPSTFL